MTTPDPRALRPDCQHPQAFATGNPVAEAKTRRATALTAVMMVIEIAAGLAFGSMALLADGWHMGTHTLALGLNIFKGSFNDDWSSIMCATCLSFIPGIVFYLIGQRYFVEGIVMTGMKN